MYVSEENLKQWSKPASDTEEHKCEETLSAIKACLDSHSFGDLGIPEVKNRGSFENNTNVRRCSDVDLYVLFNNFYYSCDSNLSLITPAYSTGPSFTFLKRVTYDILRAGFGENVSLGNKSIKIDTSIKADVVPVVCLKSGEQNVGVAFYSLNKEFIINFPEQDAANGAQKNQLTNHHYKWFVRIFKTMRNQLLEEKLINNIPSYVIESLLYNVPNNLYNQTSYMAELGCILNWLLNNIHNSDLYEVNEKKQMFSPDKFPEQTTSKYDVLVFLNAIQSTLQQREAA